jgi:hypothetical protein
LLLRSLVPSSWIDGASKQVGLGKAQKSVAGRNSSNKSAYSRNKEKQECFDVAIEGLEQEIVGSDALDQYHPIGNQPTQ